MEANLRSFSRDKGLSDALTHAVNSIVMLIDVFVVKHPARYSHFVYPLAFGAFFGIGFSLPYTLLGGRDRDGQNFIYNILDWTKHPGSTTLLVIGTLIAVSLMHCLMTYFHRLRKSIHSRIHSRDVEESYENQAAVV